jgi:hypothetical protein
MDLTDVIAKLAEIKGAAFADDETAHYEQDQLYVAVLTAISKGEAKGTVARALAAEALKVQDIQFSRWYA